MILTLLILVFLILFIWALIAPKKLTSLGGGKPGRGKAFLFYFIPMIVLFIAMGKVSEKQKELAETNPEEVTYLIMSDDGLSEWPAYTSGLVNIDRWQLSDNSLTEISEQVKELKNLRKLELENNPIRKLPTWLTEMEALELLDLRGTLIDSTATEIIYELRNNGVEVRFTGTPLLPLEVDETASEEEQRAAEDEHAESFWEFAERRILYGGEDYRRKYLAGEIYYEEGIEHALVDSLGAALIDLGLFSEDKEVTAKLTQEESGVYHVKVVTIYDEAEDIKVDELASWQFIGILLKAQVFPEQEMSLSLCGDRLDVITEVSLDTQ